MMESSAALSSCCLLLLLTLTSHHQVGAETSPELPCRTVGGNNRVLDLDKSEMDMLMSYHKGTMEECLASCCSQQWREDVDDDSGISREHCNLVTYYEGASEDVNNCFLVLCRFCSFTEEKGFQFAWVHPPHQGSPHHPVVKNTQADTIMPFIRHALPPPSIYNLPSIQSQSIDANLPSKSAQQLSPWQLFKSAIAWTSHGPGPSPQLRRQRRNVEKRAGKNEASNNQGEETPPEEKPKTAQAEVEPTTKTSTSPQERPASTTQQRAESSSTTQAVELIIADESVTLLPKTASTPTTSQKMTSTQKQGEEATSSTGKVTEHPASASTTEQSKSTTKTQIDAKGKTTKGNEPEQESTKTTAGSQTQGETGNAPSAQQTKAPKEGTGLTTSASEKEASSAKLEVSTGAKTTTVAPTSLKNKEGKLTTKPTTEAATPSKTTPDKETEKTLTSQKETPATQTKVTEAPKSSSTVKKVTEEPEKVSEGGETDSELVTDVLDVTEIILETSAPTEAVPSAHNQFTFHTNNFLLILSLAIGIVLVIIVIITLGKRWYEAYQRRHYNKVDYLINGMYS